MSQICGIRLGRCHLQLVTVWISAPCLHCVCTVNIFVKDKPPLPSGVRLAPLTPVQEKTTCSDFQIASLAVDCRKHASSVWICQCFGFIFVQKTAMVSHQWVHYITFSLLSVTWRPRGDRARLCREKKSPRYITPFSLILLPASRFLKSDIKFDTISLCYKIS